MARTSKLPKRLQPMLATLTDGPFDDNDWIFEDKYDGFRMVATIEGGEVTLYSRNGKIVSHNYSEVAKALEGMKHDAVIDGELVAIGSDGLSHFRTPSRMRAATRPSCNTAPSILCFRTETIYAAFRCWSRKKRLKAILRSTN